MGAELSRLNFRKEILDTNKEKYKSGTEAIPSPAAIKFAYIARLLTNEPFVSNIRQNALV